MNGTLRRTTLVLSLLVVAALLPTGGASARMDVVADGLDNPRHLSFDRRGNLYVAEAGRGGDGPCITGPEGTPVCLGLTGAVTRVDRRGRQQRVVDDLPSLAEEGGLGALGTFDAEPVADNRLLITVGLGLDPRLRDDLGPAGRRFARVYLASRDRLRVLADIGDFEIANNPDGGTIDTNGTGLAVDRGRIVLADAGGNALLRVRPRGRTSTLAVFPDRPAPAPPFLGLPPGQSIPMQSVPTSVSVGPDGDYYVGELTGFPFPQGAARVYRVPRDGGEPQVAVGGFTNIIDIVFDDEGHLYVLEFARDSLLSQDRTGALWQVRPDGRRRLIASAGLTAPSGVAVGPDGALYVSNCGDCVEPGEVLRIPARSQGTWVIPGDNVFPEGIAYDPSTRDFFVSSVTTGTIYRADVRDERMEVFLPGGEDARTAAVGMALDVRGRLVIVGGETGKVFIYDTGSGELLAAADNDEETTFLNDVVVVPGGDAYITDSFDPVLYRLPFGADEVGELEPFLDLRGTVVSYEEGFNLNGIVASPDGRYLVAVQSNTGKLFRIELATKDVREVEQNGLAINGDGLVLDGQDLYAVSNGEILHVRFTSDFARIGPLLARIREPDFDSPTTIALVDSRLLVVNSQFDALFGDAPLELPFRVTDVRIARD